MSDTKVKALMRAHQAEIERAEALDRQFSPSVVAALQIAISVPRRAEGDRVSEPSADTLQEISAAVRRLVPGLVAELQAEARAEVTRTRGLLAEALALAAKIEAQQKEKS